MYIGYYAPSDCQKEPMLKNYIKIILRSLFKQKFYTGINILGLAVSMASCLLIVLFILNELSYDRFHKNADRIYKVGASGNIGGEDFKIAYTAPPVAETLVKEFPEVDIATRIFPITSELVQYENKIFLQEEILGVDSNFFKVFSFSLLKGNITTVFEDPNTVVITEGAAKKYFGSQDPLGKILSFGNDKSAFQVIGVVKNPPHNSQFTFSMLTSISSYPIVKKFDWSWVWSGVITYVKLNPGAVAQELEAKFPKMIRAYGGYTIGRIFDMSMDEFEKEGGGLKLFLQPLTEVYLHSNDIEGGIIKQGNIQYLYIFAIVAAFIIFLACINFMNLSTARSMKRSKEVGIRKVLGTTRRNLISRFLGESLLMTFVAMFIALALTQLFLLSFNSILFENFNPDLLTQPGIVIILMVIVIVVGLGAGSYPAFYLSAFKPVDVLKGKTHTASSGNNMRSLLVVFQFVVSISLIVCTLLVMLQLNLLHNKNLGIDKENLLVLESNRENFKTDFKNTLAGFAAISRVSMSNGGPGKPCEMELFVPEGNEQKEDMLINNFFGDYDFVNTFSIEVLRGRNFSREFPSDADPKIGAVLINEAAAKMLGWDDPIGKHLMAKDDGLAREVVGVVKNFNYESLHKEIAPLVIRFSENGNFMYVRLKPGNLQSSIQTIEKIWKQENSSLPFQYSFLDQELASQYHTEQRLGTIFTIFTSLAIFIACLGLFGLVSFMAEQRTKEIGIRKVLGASLSSVANLLSKELVKLVVIANFIAWPIAWYAMNLWLQRFAYHINIEWYVFVIAALIAFIIAVVTVSFQSIKAAMANPIDSLKSE